MWQILKGKVKGIILKINNIVYKIKLRQVIVNNRSIFLINIPHYLNYGDQAIIFAENLFFQQYFKEIKIIPIFEYLTSYSIPIMKKKVKPRTIITSSGGGNMSDIWSEIDEHRNEVFANFLHQKVIIFPQSIDYNLKVRNYNRISLFNNLAKNAKNPIIFARESFSYNFLKDNLPKNCGTYLVPDMVLFLSGRLKKNNINRENLVTTFFREDLERSIDTDTIKKSIITNYIVKNSDMRGSGDINLITKKNVKRIIYSKLKEFYSSKLIITDRLHGMIFAVITGTPAIVFDNSNHKIKHVYDDWLKDVPYIHFIDGNNDNLDSMVIEMNNIIKKEERTTKKYKIPNFDDKFKPMINVIKEAMYGVSN